MYKRLDNYRKRFTAEAVTNWERKKAVLEEIYGKITDSEMAMILIKESDIIHIPNDELSLKKLKLMSKYSDLI